MALALALVLVGTMVAMCANRTNTRPRAGMDVELRTEGASTHSSVERGVWTTTIGVENLLLAQLDREVRSNARHAAALGLVSLSCPIGQPFLDGGVFVTHRMGSPGYPNVGYATIVEGTLLFMAAPGQGQAEIVAPTSARGIVRWQGATIGELGHCEITEVQQLNAVHGRTVHRDGTVSVSGGVEGCGGDASPLDGEFVLYAPPGTCSLRAVQFNGLGRSYGDAVVVTVQASGDLVGVTLVAPELPEWIDPNLAAPGNPPGGCAYELDQAIQLRALKVLILEDSLATGGEIADVMRSEIGSLHAEIARLEAQGCTLP